MCATAHARDVCAHLCVHLGVPFVCVINEERVLVLYYNTLFEVMEFKGFFLRMVLTVPARGVQRVLGGDGHLVL